MPRNRCLAASRPSSKRGGFASGCDQSGCSARDGGDGPRHPGGQPLLQQPLVVVGELSVGGQQLEHRDRVPQVPLGEVVLLGADYRGRDEVAVARRGVLHQLAAEQLADQRLEDHVRREDRLAPVVDGGEPLRGLPDALPRRVAVPGLDVRGAVEAVDLLAQGQVVERQVLGRPDPVHAVHRDRVVVHVGRRPPVGVREQVKPEPVVDVHPGADVALHEAHPVRVPLLERLGLPGRVDVLVELPHHVRVVAVERELPLLVRVAELVPAERGPVVALAAGAGEALGLGPVGSPRLERRPVQRVAAAAVGEAVQPALGEVVPRIRLDLDRHVLVVGLLALLRRVVVEPARARVRKLLGSGLRVREDGLGKLRSSEVVISSLFHLRVPPMSPPGGAASRTGWVSRLLTAAGQRSW